MAEQPEHKNANDQLRTDNMSTNNSMASNAGSGNRPHRRSRAHIHLDENSQLNVLRSLNHLLQRPEMNVTSQNERPMAVVGGIGRSGPMDAGGIDENAAMAGSTFVRAAAIPHCQHTDWEALREFRVQEMNEIRQRAAHMENTMRWWLLSAEQWRERWMLAKGERNRLREENVRLRTALAKANAEMRAATTTLTESKMEGENMQIPENFVKNDKCECKTKNEQQNKYSGVKRSNSF